MPHARGFVHGPRSVEDFIDGLERPNREVLLLERDGRRFGFATFTLTDGWLMEIGLIACEKQRTGAGLFAVHWLKRRGFEELGVHRIFLEVVEDNIAARALYERAGFRQEGCYSDGFRSPSGEFRNLIPYGILASSYPADGA